MKHIIQYITLHKLHGEISGTSPTWEPHSELLEIPYIQRGFQAPKAPGAACGHLKYAISWGDLRELPGSHLTLFSIPLGCYSVTSHIRYGGFTYIFSQRLHYGTMQHCLLHSSPVNLHHLDQYHQKRPFTWYWYTITTFLNSWLGWDQWFKFLYDIMII